MKNSGAILIILAGILNALGQFCWKLSGAKFNIFLLIGFLLFVSGGFLIVFSLKYGELSKLHCLTGISYVVAFSLSVFYFKESFNIRQIIGCILILVGIIRLGFNGDKNV